MSSIHDEDEQDFMKKSVTQSNLHQTHDISKGFTFQNILVCGASGIGKTSFIDLFMKKLNKVEYFENIKSEVTKYSPMNSSRNQDGKIYNLVGTKGPTEDWPESSLESYENSKK